MAASRTADVMIKTTLTILCGILVACEVIDALPADCPASRNVPFNATLSQDAPVQQNIVAWEAILLIVCFGVFALFMALLHRLIRACVYYDGHLLDTFFDAGGDVNFALVASAVTARWLWTSSFSWSSAATRNFGIAGHFWYAAAASVHLLLFAILAAEIRIKAPGAKTFLQVIHSRFGAVPHVIILIFALITNIIISGMIMMEGTRVLTLLCPAVSREIILLILTIAVGVYTIVGGAGGALYMAFFSIALIVSIMLVYFSTLFFNPALQAPTTLWPQGASDVYKDACSPTGPADNSYMSVMTFMSRGAMMHGIVIVLCGFSSVFVNQSFWSVAVSAKPTSAVWGYLCGAVAWFGIPLMLSFTFGMAYWAISAQAGFNYVSDTQAALGYLPAIVSQKLMGSTGDFMMYSLTLAVVLAGCSSEILSITSIIVYDIYHAYIAPFTPTVLVADGAIVPRSRETGDYLEYNDRSVVVKYFVVTAVAILIYPIALVLLAIGIDLPWLFMFLGVLCGSAVMPIVLSITWHRTTGPGVASGAVAGVICGLIAWLAYASTFPHGLAWFRVNTGRPEVFIAGSAVSLGVGGIVCIVVSLACGGCDPHLLEDEEWEKVRKVDNPAMPWSVRYAQDMSGLVGLGGLPQWFEIRQRFRCAEISAYVVGILLVIGAIFAWPALMLIAGIFNYQAFYSWTWMVLIWGASSTVFLCLIPLLYELLVLCRQAYNNRAWIYRDGRQVLVEDECSLQAAPTYAKPRIAEVRAIRTIGYSDRTSTLGSTYRGHARSNATKWYTLTR